MEDKRQRIQQDVLSEGGFILPIFGAFQLTATAYYVSATVLRWKWQPCQCGGETQQRLQTEVTVERNGSYTPSDCPLQSLRSTHTLRPCWSAKG